MAQKGCEVERLHLVTDGSPSCVNSVKCTAKMPGHRRYSGLPLLHLLRIITAHEQQECSASAQKSAAPARKTSAKLLHQAGIPEQNLICAFPSPEQTLRLAHEVFVSVVQ